MCQMLKIPLFKASLLYILEILTPITFLLPPSRQRRHRHPLLFSYLMGLESIRTKTTTEFNQEVQGKAYEFDKLMILIKEKVMSSNKHEKVKLLTLTPDSWSRKKVAELFNVSECLVRSAREPKKKKGILDEPDQIRGKMLSDSTLTLVTRFFEDDEYSRVMPGITDFVSIGSKQHMQKRLLLCKLKELHSAFKKKHVDVKIGFSKFCSLRPKWCVLAGAAGTHSVCVCKTKQG